MNAVYRWVILVLLVLGSLHFLVRKPFTKKINKIESVRVESVLGQKHNRIILTQKASERLGIQTTPIRREWINGAWSLVVPYASVLYGLNGETWVYVSPEPLTYMRHLVRVSSISGDMVALSLGPSLQTNVVTVGVSELYGADTGVGK